MRKRQEGTLTWSSSILAPVYNSTLPSAKTSDVQEPLLIRQSRVQRDFVNVTRNQKNSTLTGFQSEVLSHTHFKDKVTWSENKQVLFVCFCFSVISESGTQLRGGGAYCGSLGT